MPITKESRKEIPPRGPGKKSYIIKALEKRSMSQEDFWDNAVGMALNGEGNAQLIQFIGQRLEPPFKPTMQPVSLDIKVGDSLELMASKVMASELPPDVMEKMLQAIKLRHEISEKGELQQRLERIEEMLKNGGTAKAD